MRTVWTILVIAGVSGVAGCTHRSLTRNTVLTTTTVMDIQYQSVLANLALLSCQPEALPNHVHLADGVVQINDRAGIGQAGGLTSLGSDFGIEQFGPSAQRQVTEQWGTDATTDPERLYDLQSLYRVAIGLPPLPPPNGIAYLRRDNPTPSAIQPAAQVSEGNGKSDGSDSDERGRIPLNILLSDVPPPGWYHLGEKKDVPKHACYVGRYGKRYAWVTDEGVADLAKFTLTVLAVIKLDPGQGGSGKGLAVTGGG